MMNSSKSTQGIFTGLFLLILGCISLVSLCGYILHWCMNILPVRHAAFIAGLGGVGLMTLLWQTGQTCLRTRQLIAYARLPLTSELLAVVHDLRLDPEHIILIQSPQPVAFCAGFLRPRIYLSTGLFDLLSRVQIKAALLHEDYHRQRYDPLRLLCIEAITTALFFLPIVREWRVISKLRMELEADAHAIGQTGKVSLAGALYRILSYGPAPTPMSGVVAAGLNTSTTRIAVMLGERPAMQQVSLKNILYSTAILWIICLVLMI